MRHGDAGDEHGEAGRFRPVELRVFEIDVVHDLGDRLKRAVGEPHPVNQNLECAAVAHVREFRIEQCGGDMALRRAEEIDGTDLVDTYDDDDD